VTEASNCWAAIADAGVTAAASQTAILLPEGTDGAGT
jgi:hypothetical protein